NRFLCAGLDKPYSGAPEFVEEASEAGFEGTPKRASLGLKEADFETQVCLGLEPEDLCSCLLLLFAEPGRDEEPRHLSLGLGQERKGWNRAGGEAFGEFAGDLVGARARDRELFSAGEDLLEFF